MTRVATKLGGLDIPAGASLMLIPGACNRDPRVFERPYEFDIDRPNARQHIAFGHGIHTCAGAPLARAEGRVTINRFLDRTATITISEKDHGPADARRYEYLPTFFLRGLQNASTSSSPPPAEEHERPAHLRTPGVPSPSVGRSVDMISLVCA